jgi:exonuclease III
MSTNVLFSSPLKDPEPFARVLDATDPDVVLYQEWFRTTKDDVRDWIDEHLGKDWSLIMSDDGSGVAIATKLKVLESTTKAVVEHRGDRPSRVVAAVVEAHDQQLILISLHLKCCGGAESEEDAKRIVQAGQIHDFVQELRSRYPDAGVVIGGDYNLVGSRLPLEVMADGIGSDGQDLVPVPTTCLGTQSMLTWTDSDSSFTPGRLDWLLIDDHAWTPIRSWSLDTAHLSDRVLQSSGLQREDSRATDHLPIFVDLVPKNK